ncbi:hypothetical protein [Pasteuria penetrans]|uniref:hypothetical protein n=1 Tax=Pasteuria penetrans TaxID=86005 RepID=UPI000FB4E3AE|nr:hypothetical protein [Pasteuria penetrans]
MIINRKRIAREKIERLKRGYSAFTESEEIATRIERELSKIPLEVHIDRTPLGCWFIPETHQTTDTNSSSPSHIGRNS